MLLYRKLLQLGCPVYKNFKLSLRYQTLNLDNVIYGKVRYSTESWQSMWKNFSESDKLQSAMVTDEPPNAEIAYYKGMAYKNFGPEYSADAISAFRCALSLCGPRDSEIKERCESEIRIIETKS